MAPPQRIVACCLLAVALALVAVGAVTGTVVRHLVQIVPVLLAAAVASGLPALAAEASLPVFAIWFALMAAIWLYLLGIATFFRGNFTPFEVFLTALVGLCCALGGIAALRLDTRASLARRIVALAGFAALQFAALWLSFRPGISRD